MLKCESRQICGTGVAAVGRVPLNSALLDRFGRTSVARIYHVAQTGGVNGAAPIHWGGGFDAVCTSVWRGGYDASGARPSGRSGVAVRDGLGSPARPSGGTANCGPIAF